MIMGGHLGLDWISGYLCVANGRNVPWKTVLIEGRLSGEVTLGRAASSAPPELK